MIDSSALKPFINNTLDQTDFTNLGTKFAGKVRDVYHQPDHNRRILVTTDRQSAFNVDFCTTPLKGQVLNQISAWWFERIADIFPTQVIAVPDPNVMVVKDLKMLEVEVIVRAYLTGSSKTAIWTHYDAGVRNYCGNALPEGMIKNQPLPEIIITPTTKTKDDEPISAPDLIAQGLATAEQWEEVSTKALQLFTRGQKLAAERGLILVDTKYEIGFDSAGVLTIGDEVHTPDSSRYWIADKYDDLFAAGKEPESLDKEFFRLWLREQGYEDGGPVPEITDEARLMLGSKYIDLYERMTGEKFMIPETSNIHERIEDNLTEYTVT